MATSAHETEDGEKRYYTDEEFRSYLTASQLKGLSSKDQIAHMVGWFNRMYEDPIQETPYDSEGKGYLYVWGGPFNARDELWDEFGDLVSDEVIQAAVSEVEKDGTIEWAPSGSNPKHQGGPDEDEEGSYEPVSPTLEEIRERRASGVSPKFGGPDEARGREALRSEIARLRDGNGGRAWALRWNRPQPPSGITVAFRGADRGSNGSGQGNRSGGGKAGSRRRHRGGVDGPTEESSRLVRTEARHGCRQFREGIRGGDGERCGDYVGGTCWATAASGASMTAAAW